MKGNDRNEEDKSLEKFNKFFNINNNCSTKKTRNSKGSGRKRNSKRRIVTPRIIEEICRLKQNKDWTTSMVRKALSQNPEFHNKVPSISTINREIAKKREEKNQEENHPRHDSKQFKNTEKPIYMPPQITQRLKNIHEQTPPFTRIQPISYIDNSDKIKNTKIQNQIIPTQFIQTQPMQTHIIDNQQNYNHRILDNNPIVNNQIYYPIQQQLPIYQNVPYNNFYYYQETNLNDQLFIPLNSNTYNGLLTLPNHMSNIGLSNQNMCEEKRERWRSGVFENIPKVKPFMLDANSFEPFSQALSQPYQNTHRIAGIYTNPMCQQNNPINCSQNDSNENNQPNSDREQYVTYMDGNIKKEFNPTDFLN